MSLNIFNKMKEKSGNNSDYYYVKKSFKSPDSLDWENLSNVANENGLKISGIIVGAVGKKHESGQSVYLNMLGFQASKEDAIKLSKALNVTVYNENGYAVMSPAKLTSNRKLTK